MKKRQLSRLIGQSTRTLGGSRQCKGTPLHTILIVVVFVKQQM